MFDVEISADGRESGQPVFMSHDAVKRHVFLELAEPVDGSRRAVGVFLVRVFLATERRGGRVGPDVVVRAVVSQYKTAVLSASRVKKYTNVECFAAMLGDNTAVLY